MSQATDSSTTKKPKKFRWLIWAALALVLLLVGLSITAGIVAKSYVNPDFIVSAIEAENNCRVEIGSTDVSLFSFPAKVEIKGIKITRRDEHADAGTKLADRPALPGGIINAESITLKANLFDLIRKKINVTDLTINKLFVAEFLIEREGGHSLDPLFDPPVTVKGTANPEFEEKKERRDAAKERRELPKEERLAKETTPFAISELPLPATMKVLRINDGQINAKIRKNKTRITLSNVQIKFSNIDLDASDLQNHNRADLSISAHLDVEDRDRTIKYVDFDIRSEGEVIPFDPVTGYINPDLSYEISVLKGGKLDTIPSLVKLATKIKKLNDLGLKLNALGEKVILEKDTVINLGYRNDTLTFTKPASVDFDNYTLTVLENAWLHTGSNEHEAKAEVTLSKAASDKALGNAREFLAEKAKQLSFDKEVVLKYSKKLLEPVTKNGQVWVPFTSTGDLNDPKVRPDVEIKDLAETIALEALGDILEKTQKEAGGE